MTLKNNNHQETGQHYAIRKDHWEFSSHHCFDCYLQSRIACMTRCLYINGTLLILLVSINTFQILVYIITQHKANSTLIYKSFKNFQE